MRATFSFIIIVMLLLLFGCKPNNHKAISQPHNDSIKKYLELASNDTIPFKTRDAYNKKAFSFIDLSKNDTLVRWYLFLNAQTYYRLNDLKNLKKANDILFKKAIKSKDSNKIAAAYRLYDKYFTLSSVNDSAIYYCFKAKRYYEKMKDYENLALVYDQISIIQNYESDYLGSNTSALLGLKYAKKSIIIWFLKTQIALNLYNLHEYENANKYFQGALEIINRDRQLDKYKYVLWNNIGINFSDNKNYKKAIYYFKKVLYGKNIKLINPVSYALANDMFAYCKLKTGDYNGLPQLFFDSENIRDENFIENGKNYNRIYLSEYYDIKKDSMKAIKYAREAIQISKRFKNPNDVLRSLEQLINVDHLKSGKEVQEYIRINDSLKIAERVFRDKFARIAFETNEINQEKEKAIKQKWITTSVTIGLLLIVILLFVIFRQKAKQKELQLIQEQQAANEEIYQLLLNQHLKEEEVRLNEKKRIALELHDNVMNQLASTRFNLYTISQNTDKQTIDNALRHVDKIKDIENEIRSITHNLSADVFEEAHTFELLLEKLVQEQNKIYPTHYNLEIEQQILWEFISGKIKMNLYRILQEILHNINKHAQATNASINIVQDDVNIGMSVQDNGIGFDESIAGGIGIQNMHKRLKDIDGKINIESVLEKGTTIFITIPL